MSFAVCVRVIPVKPESTIEISLRDIPRRMSVIYSPRAVRDLEQISACYRAVADARIGAAIGERIKAVIMRLAQHPLSVS